MDKRIVERGAGDRQAGNPQPAGRDPRQHRFDIGVVDREMPAVAAHVGADGEQRGNGGGVGIGARGVAHLHRQQAARVVDRAFKAAL